MFIYSGGEEKYLTKFFIPWCKKHEKAVLHSDFQKKYPDTWWTVWIVVVVLVATEPTVAWDEQQPTEITYFWLHRPQAQIGRREHQRNPWSSANLIGLGVRLVLSMLNYTWRPQSERKQLQSLRAVNHLPPPLRLLLTWWYDLCHNTRQHNIQSARGVRVAAVWWKLKGTKQKKVVLRGRVKPGRKTLLNDVKRQISWRAGDVMHIHGNNL